MTDLSRDSRALLEAARGGDDPTAAARARVRADLLARIGAGAAAGAAAARPAQAAAGATGGAGGGLLIKALVALALVGGGAAYWALRGNAPAVPAIPSSKPAPVVTPLPSPAPAPVVTPLPSPPPSPSPSPPPSPPPSPSLSTRSRPSADAIRTERALLASAHAALRAGDTTAALAILADHASRFPRGLLVEERAATQVRALCAAGDAARAAAAREAFLRRWPRSIHAERVRVTCAP